MWIGNPLGVFLIVALYALAIFMSIFPGGRRWKVTLNMMKLKLI